MKISNFCARFLEFCETLTSVVRMLEESSYFLSITVKKIIFDHNSEFKIIFFLHLRRLCYHWKLTFGDGRSNMV